jgi:hypothetical protein
MDGPVVRSAEKALATGNANFVLIWVQKGDEAELRKTFEKALAVRKLGPEARELADTYLFETAVRLHRAGEGAPYTGLKPAGRDLGPAIPAADRALETGSAEPLVRLLLTAVQDGVHRQFQATLEARRYAVDEVDAGRRYVRQYVAFVHYVERLYEVAHAAPAGHFHEGEHVDARQPHQGAP